MFQLFNIPFFVLINYFLAEISSIFYFISILLTFIFFIPFLSVTVRRLHDTNRPGTWSLLTIPVYLEEMFKIIHWPNTVTITIAIIGSIILLVMMIMPGNEGENQYGPDPKDLDIE